MVLGVVALASWAGLAGVAPVATPEPPGLVLEVTGDGTQTIHGARGSYCWNNGTQGLCVDTIGPEDLVEFHNLTASSIINGSSIQVRTLGHTAPEGYQYQFRVNGSSAGGGSILPDGSISPPRTGETVLVVSARWDAGDVYYAFLLDVTR